MAKRTTFITRAFIASLIVTSVAPIASQAGTLTIHNDNCTRLKGFKTLKQVTVEVYAGKKGCTRTSVTVGQGHTETIGLMPYWYDPLKPKDPKDCKYRHEAKGTAFGKKDVHGDQDSSVTCKKDRAGICQCTRD